MQKRKIDEVVEEQFYTKQQLKDDAKKQLLIDTLNKAESC